MLRFPCLVLDHDDTVVQSEATVNFPFFQIVLDRFRPGTKVTLQEYTDGCYRLGFADMCRQWYHFTEDEIQAEYLGWQEFVRSHIPSPFPGIRELLHRQRQAGGMICVVSHSCTENITRDYQTHFDMVPDDIYGWDLPEPLRKPSTYSLEQIMGKYGFRPNELLVVDDMKPGYEMARKAGVPIAFSAWGRKDCPQICSQIQQLCDYTFHSVKDLERFLFDSLTDMV